MFSIQGYAYRSCFVRLDIHEQPVWECVLTLGESEFHSRYLGAIGTAEPSARQYFDQLQFNCRIGSCGSFAEYMHEWDVEDCAVSRIAYADCVAEYIRAAAFFAVDMAAFMAEYFM